LLANNAPQRQYQRSEGRFGMTPWRRLCRPEARVRSGGQRSFLTGPFHCLLERCVKMQMHFRRRGGQVVREVSFGEEL